ncbi:hypothetical protein ACFL1A_02005 [Patescibacteria group bacterium]
MKTETKQNIFLVFSTLLTMASAVACFAAALKQSAPLANISFPTFIGNCLILLSIFILSKSKSMSLDNANHLTMGVVALIGFLSIIVLYYLIISRWISIGYFSSYVNGIANFWSIVVIEIFLFIGFITMFRQHSNTGGE